VKVIVYSTKAYDRQFIQSANAKFGHDLKFIEPRLSEETALLADGHPAICIFVNDHADAPVLKQLHQRGTRLIALRCAGFNNVDLEAAERYGICVVRVPAYSPYAVAEHTIGLILALNRNIARAYARVRDGNFSLDGLLGFDLHGKTAGVVGTGRIGSLVARSLCSGFGCNVLAHDTRPNAELACNGLRYASMDELLSESIIVTLHCPLTPETHHLIGADAVRQMKRGVMLINTSRGALIDTPTVVEALKDGQIGSMGLDVYEEEADLFYEDLSNKVIRDDVFARLLTFPNVVITGHQAYFTKEALANIAETTLQNIADFEQGRACPNAVYCDRMRKSETRRDS